MYLCLYLKEYPVFFSYQDLGDLNRKPEAGNVGQPLGDVASDGESWLAPLSLLCVKHERCNVSAVLNLL